MQRRAERSNQTGTNANVSTDAGLSGRIESSARSRIRRHPDRSRPELAEAILLRGRVAHVGFVHEGQPYVLPLTYHYEGGCIYLHGAPAARTMRTLAAGLPLCVEVTLLDGLVASREAKSHSLTYRSVVVFGRAQPVADDVRKRELFERMTARYFPGRTVGDDYQPARTGELRAVTLLEIAIEELSAKSRSGPALGKLDRDAHSDGSTYVVMVNGVDA